MLRSDAAATPFAKGKLDGLWPNDDLHAWSFAYRFQLGDPSFQPTLYPTPEQVPPAPAPEDVLPLLSQSFPSTSDEAGIYRLQFHGQTTTQAGVTAQNLVETLIVRGDSIPGNDFNDRLLMQVARARPDLRAKLAVRGSVATSDAQMPILLHGGAWEKTLSYIGTYGDLEARLAWKFIDNSTKAGATFRWQLIPSVAQDVYLTGWIVPNRMSDPAAKGKGVQVVYVIDYGVSEGVDASGATIGFFRDVGYGTVVYVPGTGPVSAIERTIAPVEHPENPVDQITITPSTSFVTAMR